MTGSNCDLKQVLLNTEINLFNFVSNKWGSHHAQRLYGVVGGLHCTNVGLSYYGSRVVCRAAATM